MSPLSLPLLRLLLCLTLLCGTLGGCASSAATVEGDTRGYSFELTALNSRTNLAVYYALRRSGELIYAAGSKHIAVDGELAAPTWSGMLTTAEIEPLTAIIRANQEQEEIPEVPGAVVYRLRATTPSSLFDRTLRSGPAPWLDELRGTLDAIVRRKRATTLTPPLLPQA